MFRLISVKWFEQRCLSPNRMPFLVIKSWFSTLVTGILRVAVLLSGSAIMVFMTAGESTHLWVQASLMSLVPAPISVFRRFMPPACLPYHSRSTLYIRSWCYFWSLVEPLMVGSIPPAVIRMACFITSSIMLLVAATRRVSHMFPF